MSYMSEEEKLRRIQREEERRKREEAMLQEEELRHIRELERIRQMNGPDEDDDYDPEMDSAFVVDDPSDGQLFAGAQYNEQENVQPQYGAQNVQVPPNTQFAQQSYSEPQYEQAPQYTQQIQVPPTRPNDGGYGQPYVQQPQYDQAPPQFAQQPYSEPQYDQAPQYAQQLLIEQQSVRRSSACIINMRRLKISLHVRRIRRSIRSGISSHLY